MKLWRRATIRYLSYGALFGLMFPIFASLGDMLLRELPIGLESLLHVQATQPLHWMIDTAPLFLGLFAAAGGWRQDQVERLNGALRRRNQELEDATSRAQHAEELLRLNAENSELARQSRQQLAAMAAMEATLEQAASTIRALALPLIPVGRAILAVPLIGDIDAARAADLRRLILEHVAGRAISIVIFDCTGVTELDSAGANALAGAIAGLELLGAAALLTGITPDLAHQLLDLPQHIRTAPDLAAGIGLAQRLAARPGR